MHILRSIKFVAVAVLGLLIIEKAFAEEFHFSSDIDVNRDQLISFLEFKNAVGRIFRDADVNKDGVATLEELTEYAGLMDASQMENWLFSARLSQLDFNNDLDISLEELSNNENLKALFQQMDMNINGYLSPRELENTAAARILGKEK